jgi:hypothetical protein
MITSRKQISFGVPFTISVNNVREQELEVLNFHDRLIDGIDCKITNTTSYVPPTAYVTDEANGIIRLKFHDKTPINTGLELVLRGVVAQKVEVTQTNVLIDGQAAKDGAVTGLAWIWRTIKAMFIGFIVASVIFTFIKGTTFGDILMSAWSKFNAATAIQLIDELDPRILTNRHDVYKSAAFTEINALYKRNHGANKELKKLYRFVGGSFFITDDLIKNHDGSYMLLTKGDADAEDFCNTIGGNLLEIEELSGYLENNFLTIANIVLYRRDEIPEWSGTRYAMDNYWMYLKDSNAEAIKNIADQMGDEPDELKKIGQGRFIEADNGDVEAAFRCGLSGNIFRPAQ